MGVENDHEGYPEVGEANFEAEVLHSTQPALVAFGAGWSKPCQIIRSVLIELEEKCAGKVRILRVNVDDYPDLGMLYGIESIPTLLYFVEGRVRARIVGTASKEAILSKLQPFGIGV